MYFDPPNPTMLIFVLNLITDFVLFEQNFNNLIMPKKVISKILKTTFFVESIKIKHSNQLS